MDATQLLPLLEAALPAEHVRAAVHHFQDAVADYQKRQWDDATAKMGKFVEAVLKALVSHAGLTLPDDRGFKVDVHINELAKSSAADTVRLTIPRACRFIYEVASNRGARHDPGEIDPNEMDATAVVNLSAWVLAELLRYAQKGGDMEETGALVRALMERRYPFVEDVDGRTYFHVKGASAREVALLSLWRVHPRRIPTGDLVEAVKRHGFVQYNAEKGVQRARAVTDDDGQGRLVLLSPGLQEAEQLLEGAQKVGARPRKKKRKKR